jgi:UDP-N-acetylmuramate: L-alanyl-gamma-D-glutamyl-meso-diaminopimelate ligase
VPQVWYRELLPSYARAFGIFLLFCPVNWGHMPKYHFIAIGGSVMHNLAIALKQAGHQVTGSDDEIYEPSRSVLQKYALLPPEEGWHPGRVTADLDAVILGMHAKKDNPELLKAQQLGIAVYSFPEFIYNQSKDKQRIVIAGSHGKTTITAAIIHVLNYHHKHADYVIGAQIKGIEHTVRLSDAPIIIIEGDEYLSSALDPSPKFLRYQHHIGLISGIAWDHANVFPSEDEYARQFDRFADNTPKAGMLLYCEGDPMASVIGAKQRADVLSIPYKTHAHVSDQEKNYLTSGKDRFPIRLFGTHNLQNLSGAKELLKRIGVTSEQFFEAITSFEGASGRLETLVDTPGCTVIKDFAHAPSKVRASVKAVKELHPQRETVACLELHTYSSLNRTFLPQYKDALKGVHLGMVYFNPEKVTARKLEPITVEEVKAAFGSQSLQVFTEVGKLKEFLIQQSWKNKNLLLMSSGNFGGLNVAALAKSLCE